MIRMLKDTAPPQPPKPNLAQCKFCGSYVKMTEIRRSATRETGCNNCQAI